MLTVFELVRVSAPTFVESLAGRVTRARCDDRMRAFGERVVARARIQLEVVGRERVPRDRAFVFMSNHQSHLDIPILYATIPAETLRMVAKTELFRIPLWGRTIRHVGMIEVNRSNHDDAIASLRRAGDAIADGVSIWIAPEGTRSKTGELGPLKRGGFHLAVDTGTPIVPIAITGTGDILPPHAYAMAYDKPVRVEFGAPVAVTERTIDEVASDVEKFFRERLPHV